MSMFFLFLLITLPVPILSLLLGQIDCNTQWFKISCYLVHRQHSVNTQIFIRDWEKVQVKERVKKYSYTTTKMCVRVWQEVLNQYTRLIEHSFLLINVRFDCKDSTYWMYTRTLADIKSKLRK